jgi:hypothetical protein
MQRGSAEPFDSTGGPALALDGSIVDHANFFKKLLLLFFV